MGWAVQDWTLVVVRFSAPIQTGPGAHQASHTHTVYQVSFPGHDINHPPPSSPKVKERVQLYLYSSSGPSWPVIGWTFTSTLYTSCTVLLFILTARYELCWPTIDVTGLGLDKKSLIPGSSRDLFLFVTMFRLSLMFTWSAILEYHGLLCQMSSSQIEAHHSSLNRADISVCSFPYWPYHTYIEDLVKRQRGTLIL